MRKLLSIKFNAKLNLYWNGWNVLHTAAARVAGLDMGFVPAKGGRDLAGILAGAQDGSVKIISGHIACFYCGKFGHEVVLGESIPIYCGTDQTKYRFQVSAI